MSKAVFVSGSILGGASYTSDVYMTEDAVTFTKMADFPVFTNGTSVIYFKDGWYATGGYDANGTNVSTTVSTFFRNTVYKSTDLTSWTLISSTFPARYNHSIFVYQDKIWVIGGQTYADNAMRCYNSTDGITWTLVSNVDNSWSAPQKFACPVVAHPTLGIFVLGGGDWGSTGANYTQNKIYHSMDGITWDTATPTWVARKKHVALFFNNKFYIIGGTNAAGTVLSDNLWYSSDGYNWTQGTSITNTNLKISLAGQLAGALDGKLIMFGTSKSNYGKLVSSSDGITWIDGATLPSEISTRYAANLAIKDEVPIPTIRMTASSSSTVSVALDIGTVLAIRGNASTISSVSVLLTMPNIVNLRISASSISNSNLYLLSNSYQYLSQLNALSASSVNILIGFNDISTYILSGLVTYNTTPIQGATIIAINENYPQYVYKTTTDEQGKYNLICNITGEYVLICYHKNGSQLFTSTTKPFVRIGGA